MIEHLAPALDVWLWALALFAGLGAVGLWLLKRSGHEDGSFTRRYLLQGLLIVIALLPPWFGAQAFGFGLAAYACVAAHEVSGVLSHVAAFVRPLRWVGALAPALACLVLVSVVRPLPFWVPLMFGVVGVVLPWGLFASRNAGRLVFVALTCALWPGVSLAGMALLGTRRSLPFDIAFLYGVLEVNDSAAYIIGRSFGKHLIAPRISPHKTWEGAIAGLLAATLTGTLVSFAEPRFSTAQCAAIALGLSALGACADLSASAVKRAAAVKDFGTWLGPHGGFIDAYDSFVLVAPFFCAVIALFDG